MPHLWDTIWQSHDAYGTVGDWAIATLNETLNPGGLQDLDPLGTAVMLCLFTDGRAPDDMLQAAGLRPEVDQHEWHGNTYDLEDNEEPMGSLLWLFERMPLNDYNARMCVHHAAEALQPLVRQKLATHFEIGYVIDKVAGRLSLLIRAMGRIEGTRTYFADLYPLQ